MFYNTLFEILFKFRINGKVFLEGQVSNLYYYVFLTVIGTLLVIVVRRCNQRASHRHLLETEVKNPTMNSIENYFKGAKTYTELLKYIEKNLDRFWFDSDNTLIATSLCCDVVNRPLEKALSELYNNNNHYYAMGGLTGIPFGGVSAFRTMASHIPDNGSCLLVYGPHVGINEQGQVGTINRTGKQKGHASGCNCCVSAITAAEQVKHLPADVTSILPSPNDIFDAQQSFVCNLILQHRNRIEHAINEMVELPYVMYDIQTELINKIISKGCDVVSDDGEIIILGGIQINTPMSDDYFLPLRFDVFNNRGEIIENILQTTTVNSIKANTATIVPDNEVQKFAQADNSLTSKSSATTVTC